LVLPIKNALEDHTTFSVPIRVDAAWTDTNWKEKRELPKPKRKRVA
jgi:hypothetical protein